MIFKSLTVYGFYEHQIPGWIGRSESGHCSHLKGYVKGVVRTSFGNPDDYYFVVPCDYVVKGTLALIVSLGTLANPSDVPQIIHLSNSGTINPTTMQDFANILNEESWKNPCDSYLFVPRCKLRNGWRAIFYIALSYLLGLIIYIPDKALKLSPPWMRYGAFTYIFNTVFLNNFSPSFSIVVTLPLLKYNIIS